MSVFTSKFEAGCFGSDNKTILLDDMEAYALTFPHGEGRTRVSDRATYLGLIDIARRFGRVVDPGKGVEVAASQRQIANIASIGLPTASKAIHRLEDEGLLYYVEPAKDDWRLEDDEARIWTRYGMSRIPRKLNSMSLPQHSDIKTRLIRNPSVSANGLGKTRAWILDLVVADEGITLEKLATTLRKRERDVRRDYTRGLEEDGYIYEERGGFYPALNLGELLRIHHKKSGSDIAASKQRTRHNEERIRLEQGKRKYRNRKRQTVASKTREYRL